MSMEPINRLMRVWTRHLLPLAVSLELQGKVQVRVYSGFLLGIRKRVFLVTAGHGLIDVRRAIAAGVVHSVGPLARRNRT